MIPSHRTERPAPFRSRQPSPNELIAQFPERFPSSSSDIAPQLDPAQPAIPRENRFHEPPPPAGPAHLTRLFNMRFLVSCLSSGTFTGYHCCVFVRPYPRSKTLVDNPRSPEDKHFPRFRRTPAGQNQLPWAQQPLALTRYVCGCSGVSSRNRTSPIRCETISPSVKPAGRWSQHLRPRRRKLRTRPPRTAWLDPAR